MELLFLGGSLIAARLLVLLRRSHQRDRDRATAYRRWARWERDGHV